MDQKSLIFFDSETSGVCTESNQILSFAMVKTDLDLNPLKKLYYTVKLRSGARVNQSSLQVNHLNPYHSDWNKKSISEKELRGEIISFCDDIKDGSLFIAYNAPFDKKFIKKSFQTANIEISSVFRGDIIDPMIGAKYCTKNRLILTDLKKNMKGEWFHSFSLQEVSETLKTAYPGPSHHSLNDCMTLASTTKKIYEIQFKMNFSKTFFANSKAWKIS